ncbi:hypothetical protein ZWY2020_013949 [Hordeum vulgare]|nr:hypothetical protein ZWY2020_013949 [Hordeum vulgare]
MKGKGGASRAPHHSHAFRFSPSVPLRLASHQSVLTRRRKREGERESVCVRSYSTLGLALAAAAAALVQRGGGGEEPPAKSAERRRPVPEAEAPVVSEDLPFSPVRGRGGSDPFLLPGGCFPWLFHKLPRSR